VENLLRCGARGNVAVIDENRHTDDLRRKTHVARHDDHRYLMWMARFFITVYTV
jgi:hypothetical protein